MPINLDALSGEDKKDEKAEEVSKPAAKAKAKRRTKTELIADATIPGDEENVEIKMTQNGSKVERPWLVAVELFREDKAEFVDKSLKYAVLKMDQQKEGGSDFTQSSSGAAQASPNADEIDGLTKRWSELQERLDNLDSQTESTEHETLTEESDMVRVKIMELGGQDPASDEAYQQRAGSALIPEGAELGDEIIINGDKSYVGHGGFLTQISPSVSKDDMTMVKPKRRWIQTDGEWSSSDFALASSPPAAAPKPASAPQPKTVESETVKVPGSVEQVSELVYKVSGGYLEKIGLPDYSSFQIGPTMVQHHVVDDGRRVEVEMGGRTVKLPASVVEGLQECFQISEYVMRAERQAAINFLEAVKPGSTTS